MRIGTVTLWDSENNYGQILQCFALIKFLRIHGHEAFLIKFKQSNKQLNYFRRILNGVRILLKSPSLFIEILHFKKLDYNIKKSYVDRKFSIFRDKYIPSTEKVYNENELFANPPHADAYICGSDQIWSEVNPIMYLQFTSPKTKRIAYAASFGGKTPSDIDKLKEILKTFDYVSLREKSGVDLCQKLGYNNAELVPDPTLLLTADIYRNLCTNQIVENDKYILLYLLGNEIPVSVESIFEFASRNNLRIKYVASQGRIDEYPKIYPTIEEWINLIDNASYVITNSYHGTIFSLLLNTPFAVIPLSGMFSRMNVRIYDLLSKYELTNRIIKDKLEVVLDTINFDTFNNIQVCDIYSIENKINSIVSI